MRFSLSATIVLVITVLSALTLVFASNAKFKFYEDLELKQQLLIIKIKKTDPLVIDEENFSDKNLPDDGWIKLVHGGGYYKEYLYYQNKKLIAIDKLDEGGRLVRRDLIFKGDVRAQHFFNTKGDLIKNIWIDINGNIINYKTIFIPLTNIRTGY